MNAGIHGIRYLFIASLVAVGLLAAQVILFWALFLA